MRCIQVVDEFSNVPSVARRRIRFSYWEQKAYYLMEHSDVVYVRRSSSVHAEIKPGALARMMVAIKIRI